MASTSAAAMLVDILEEENVDVIFGLPGGPLLPILDELFRRSSIGESIVSGSLRTH